MIQLRHLRYFVGIVDAGSLSRAASTLFVAQPALSQQMADLEQQLGVALLHRSARGVRPTPAGELLYREAQAILRHVEKLPDLVRDSGGEVSGAVSLGMSSTVASFLAGPFIEVCRNALPRVNLNLVTQDSVSLKSRIDAHGLDLAVVFEPQATPDQPLMPLFRQRLYLVDRRKLPGHPRSVPLQRVAALPLVLGGASNVLRRVLDRAFADAGLQPKVVVETNLLSSMLAAVHSGAGATVVPLGEFSALLGRGALAATPIEPALYLTACVAHDASSAPTRATEAVRALLAGVIARLLRDKAPPGMEPVQEG
ncbi:MAG TPA: LysR substrate-binding domain-containing protein [Burkholderiaceae bacterium]|nr:LysR substrate-binding domain-containing protein [Burkholderiaceae bacterium]